MSCFGMIASIPARTRRIGVGMRGCSLRQRARLRQLPSEPFFETQLALSFQRVSSACPTSLSDALRKGRFGRGFSPPYRKSLLSLWIMGNNEQSRESITRQVSRPRPACLRGASNPSACYEQRPEWSVQC
jgi:hypothetical protein